MNDQLPVGPPNIVEIPVDPAVPMMEIASSNIQVPGEQDDVAVTSEQPMVIPAPPQAIAAPPSQAIPQPNPLPPPPPVIPQPNPLPLPPPVIPQPTPLPMPPALLPAQPPMQGFDSASLPLDAPLPEAPRIPVAAAPQEQTMSQEVTNALMDELSD